MYTYLENIGPLSSLTFLLKSLSLCSKLRWIFCSCLLKHNLGSWPLGDHLNFQNSYVRTNTNLISVFVLKPWFPKNHYENMGSCIVFREKGNTPNNSWCSGFMSKGCARVSVLFAWNNNKNERTSWTQETHDLTKKKCSFDRKSLVAL